MDSSFKWISFNGVVHTCNYTNKTAILSLLLFQNGRKDGIRTHGLLVPNQAHYQAVLLPE